MDSLPSSSRRERTTLYQGRSITCVCLCIALPCCSGEYCVGESERDDDRRIRRPSRECIWKVEGCRIGSAISHRVYSSVSVDRSIASSQHFSSQHTSISHFRSSSHSLPCAISTIFSISCSRWSENNARVCCENYWSNTVISNHQTSFPSMIAHA